MTKLQLLHRALNERLMAAVEQIMEMVGGTVHEYEQEAVRVRRENETLRRRLRWMEGDIPTDWPDDIDPPDIEQPVVLEPLDGQLLERLLIKTEPSDSQSFRLDAGSVRSSDLEMVDAGTIKSTDAVLSNCMTWDSAQSYMAPLDFDPTPGLDWSRKGRNQRMSFACPDCGKVFGREQTLVFHMRVHSSEKPYTYRRRKKVCFYGNEKRKKKLHGLSTVYPSRECVEDVSDSSERTKQSTASTATAPNAPEAAKDGTSAGANKYTASSKHAENKSAKPVGHERRQGQASSKVPRCLECKRVFKSMSRLAKHMKTHRKPLATEEQQHTHKMSKKPQQNLKKPVVRNNETEVEKAQTDGQTFFQCPVKKLPSNKMQKDIGQVSTEAKENAKEITTENDKALKFRKVVSCPHCDKVYTCSGWLESHIRSHAEKPPRMSDIVPQNILPESFLGKTRHTIAQLSKEASHKEKRSEKSCEPQTTIGVNLRSKSDSKSTTSIEDREEIVPESNQISKESKVISEESSEETGGTETPRKYICRVCGKSYVHLGWLKTHLKMHIKERMEKRKTTLKKYVKENTKEQNLVGRNEKRAIQSSDKMKKNGGCAVTTNQTSATFQDHTSTTEPLETISPQSVCADRKFSLLPLHSTGGASNFSINTPRTDSKSVITTSPFSLQPRIVLEPIPVDLKTWASLGEEEDGLVIVKIRDDEHKVSHAKAVDVTSCENNAKTVFSDINFTLKPEKDNPDDSCVKLPSPEKVLFNTRDQQTAESSPRRMPELLQKDDQEETDGQCRQDVKGKTVTSQPKLVAVENEESGTIISDITSSVAHQGLADLRAIDGSLPKSSENAISSNVEFLSSKTEEQRDSDGPFANSNETTLSQKMEEKSTVQKSSSTCMTCGLKFSGWASLSLHMHMHSTSADTNRKAVTSKTLESITGNKKRKIIKQDVDFQTSEVERDSSADNSELLQIGAKTSKSSGHHIDSGTTNRSSKGDSKTTRNIESKKERKVLYCRFCSKACRKIELHLKYDHPKEPEVMEALHSSKTSEEKKKLLSRLCSKEKARCDGAVVVKDDGLVHCLFCQGSYRRSEFWKHALICGQKKDPAEASSSVHTPNISAINRSKVAPKILEPLKPFNPVSDHLVEDNICNTAEEPSAESVNAPFLEIVPSTEQKSFSDPPCPQSGSNDLKLALGTAWVDPQNCGTVKDTVRLKLDCTDSGPSIAHTSFTNAEKTHETSLETNSSLDSGSSAMPENQDCFSPQNMHFEGEGVFSQRPTTDRCVLPQPFLSEGNNSMEGPDKCEPNLDSEYFLAPNPFTNVLESHPEARNPFIQDFVSSTHQAHNVELLQLPDPEPTPSILEILDSESHIIEDKNEIGEDGHRSDLKLDSSCTTIVKRKLDSNSSVFKEADTKRIRQTDLLQAHTPPC